MKILDLALKDVTLKNYCSMHVGGKCNLFFSPVSIKELKIIIKYCKKNNIKYYILGNGTNVIFKSNGFSGAIISTKKLSAIKTKRNIIKTLAGTSLYKLNLFLANEGLKGLEWSFGIPGTVGGAVKMNAGAYGCEICDFIKKIEVFDGKYLKIIKKKDIAFSYRNTSLKDNYVVTKVWLELKKGEKDQIINLQKNFMQKRKASQPLEYFNSGSIFKKINGESAGKIIDNLGLKGDKINDAEVSILHANFIINKGNATGEDVINLIEKIKEEVYNKTGKILEQEVIVVGD